MKSSNSLTTRDFEILDARHLLSAFRKHLAVLKAVGVKDSDIKEFEAVILAAERHNQVAEIAAQSSLDQARHDVRQRLGAFRRWAEVVARLPTGIDAAAWKTLKLDVEFPKDDGELAKFMKGLEAAMRKYSARLAARSFDRDAQQGLLDAYAGFLKLGKEVVAQKSTRKSVSGDRNSSFAMLRSYTRHYRQLGLAAFYGQVGERDFRRLTKAKKIAKAAAAKSASGNGAHAQESQRQQSATA